MQNLLLTDEEYCYLQTHKLNFETQHRVEIILPESVNNDFCSNVIIATIYGEEQNIEIAKNTLKEESKHLQLNNLVSSVNTKKFIPLIVLSDSEPECAASTALSENRNNAKKKRKKKMKSSKLANSSTTSTNKPSQEVNSISGSSSDANPSKKRKFIETISPSDEEVEERIKRLKSLLCGVLSPTTPSSSDTTEEYMAPGCSKSGVANESIIILEDTPPVSPVEEIIPLNNDSSDWRRLLKSNTVSVLETNKSVTNLRKKKKPKNKKKSKKKTSITHNVGNGGNLLNEVAVINNALVPRPLPNPTRVLRPIVIDGSNVARLHGQALKTYSCKGIAISVDYFLRRGHTQITVFVPMFRRHKTSGPFPTTDPSILEEMAKTQRVVFTPSRTVNKKNIACYDDRFVIELACSNNGVMLSNDNFRDLMGESLEFKKTIEERLLMFCFVGDKIMIPNDPLGPDGPTLDEFLSFTPKNEVYP